MIESPGPRYAVQMINIEKYFGLVCALKNITFDVGRNEIVGLIGDNGAGKSTLVKILTGVFPPTNGQMVVAGRQVNFKKYNVHQAHAHGVETVYQDRSLGEKQVLWRNFFIGREILLPFGFIDVKEGEGDRQRNHGQHDRLPRRGDHGRFQGEQAFRR